MWMMTVVTMPALARVGGREAKRQDENNEYDLAHDVP